LRDDFVREHLPDNPFPSASDSFAPSPSRPFKYVSGFGKTSSSSNPSSSFDIFVEEPSVPIQEEAFNQTSQKTFQSVSLKSWNKETSSINDPGRNSSALLDMSLILDSRHLSKKRISFEDLKPDVYPIEEIEFDSQELAFSYTSCPTESSPCTLPSHVFQMWREKTHEGEIMSPFDEISIRAFNIDCKRFPSTDMPINRYQRCKNEERQRPARRSRSNPGERDAVASTSAHPNEEDECVTSCLRRRRSGSSLFIRGSAGR